jgi:hypothetical protein
MVTILPTLFFRYILMAQQKQVLNGAIKYTSKGSIFALLYGGKHSVET